MKRTTFIDSTTAAYIEKKFDLVDFNAEYADSLHFKNQLFLNPRTQQMPFHQLAVALCRNNFILPTLAILDENLDLIDAVPFYIGPVFLNDLMQFFGEEINKKKSWQDFMTDKHKK